MKDRKRIHDKNNNDNNHHYNFTLTVDKCSEQCRVFIKYCDFVPRIFIILRPLPRKAWLQLLVVQKLASRQ